MAVDPGEGGYDSAPPIPTYDEAVAGGTAWDASSSRAAESQSLLPSQNRPGPSRRPPAGYRPPTVETEDDGSDWTSEEDDDETAQVRREIEELEIEEAEQRSRSIWGKRIPFSLSLPRWRWSLPFNIPRPNIRLPRPSIRLPSRAGDDTAGGGAGGEAPAESAEEAAETETGTRWKWPQVSGSGVVLAFARILVLMLLLGFLYLIFVSDFLNGMSRRLGPGSRPGLEELRIFLHNSVNEDHLRKSVDHFTHYAHLAGTEGDYALAEDVREMFIRAGLEDVRMDQFQAYLNYPKADGRSVEILASDGSTIWKAKLEEEDVGGETAGTQTLAFHGHSKSGDVKGPLIYANYGSRSDYQTLKDSGIDTKGAIALVRYYGTQEDLSLKVKGAELAGFAGCIVYTDPADNGFKKGDVAPGGRYMPADGVQRGSVSLSRWVIGDVLSPGWASTENTRRIMMEDSAALPRIPSLPLSSRDAVNLLTRLKGSGTGVPRDWVGGVPGVKEWWTGDASSPIVRLRNQQDEVQTQPIFNVYAKIEGIEQGERSIIIGNHRDSFSLGATDPHSGTAVMIELARVMGDLRARGWIPLRTIEFMSFDAKEYNMIGSTEYVEANEKELRENAYAYVNIDRAVVGSDFRASGSPVFNNLLLRVLDRMWDPGFNTTLRDLWNKGHKTMGALGSDGDCVPFQTIVGTSSIDLGFVGERYPEGSTYNTFDFVERNIDPGFVYHRMMTEVVGLMVLELSDRYILPFDIGHYASRLEAYVKSLEKWAAGRAKRDGSAKALDVGPLTGAAKELKKMARDFGAWEMEWDGKVMGSGGWETSAMNTLRKSYNDRMAAFETKLLDAEGIPGRTQFKHVVYGPSRWEDTSTSQFPAIRALVEDGEWEEVDKLVRKTAGIIADATKLLIPE
ncbi:related to glutamate carboxypeptidase II [Cephalotrichum gorgonifer]|uniref:Related to glutamate carboxypeptidase II n=1 Tax=Cephalotrichum gorgonifer TaxID=2041049 RepID=A0AAE8SWN1_9PEZI|nr:related to glutamate carboxypeptidase II [Cephalotrichum gorgonifer]